MEVECKNCHDIICFEEELLFDDDVIEITCPNCNQVVFVNDGSMPLPQGARKPEKQPEKQPEKKPVKGKPESEDTPI